MTKEAQTALEILLREHIAAQDASDRAQSEKIDAMYKILVTGNGAPSLPEQVRRHEELLGYGKWITALIFGIFITDAVTRLLPVFRQLIDAPK